MKVMLVHNFYGSGAPSGENMVVESESDLLVRNGHDVSQFFRYSDDIRSRGSLGLLIGAVNTPWSFSSYRNLKRQILQVRPDLIHVHNSFPLLSPSIFYAASGLAPTVLTLHNYRLFCSAAIPMRRDGKICTRCLQSKSIVPSLSGGCYRHSYAANFPVAFGVGLHRLLGTWTKRVDAFITLTEFQRELMVASGLPASLTHVKPNFFPGNPSVIPWCNREDIVVFAGRLSREKGVLSLVRSWIAWGDSAPRLIVIGDGPLRGELQALADGVESIEFWGQKPNAVVNDLIAKSKLVMVPSEWFECFPMVIREAFAFGTPVAVSSVGPLPSIVKHGVSGVVFDASRANGLLDCVRDTWSRYGVLEALSTGARREFDERYNEFVNYSALSEIYNAAVRSFVGRRVK